MVAYGKCKCGLTPAAHALPGCHTGTSYFGIGKGAPVKIQLSLNLLGNTDGPPFSELAEQVTSFLLAAIFSTGVVR